jgi:hypothetical protein
MESDLAGELCFECLGRSRELSDLFGQRGPRRCHCLFHLLGGHETHGVGKLTQGLAKFFYEFLELGLNGHQPGGLVAGFRFCVLIF